MSSQKKSPKIKAVKSKKHNTRKTVNSEDPEEVDTVDLTVDDTSANVTPPMSSTSSLSFGQSLGFPLLTLPSSTSSSSGTPMPKTRVAPKRVRNASPPTGASGKVSIDHTKNFVYFQLTYILSF